MKTLHVFGDSHASAKYSAWGKINLNINIKTHHVGPKLMYSFGRDKLKMLDISNYGVKDNDIVCFCFGEIDCRNHIHKHVNNQTYQEIIHNITQSYIDAIKLNVKNYTNLKVLIYNVLPPAEKAITRDNKTFPFLGTDNERIMYTQYMNQCLEKLSIDNEYCFVNIYNDVATSSGLIDPNKTDGNVHLIKGEELEKFLKSVI